MRIHRALETIYRWIAIILCLALCLGSAPLNALAKETGAGIEATQNDMAALTEEGVDESNDSTGQGYTDNNKGTDNAENTDQNDGNEDSGDSGETDKDNPNYNDGSNTADDGEGTDESTDGNNTDSVSENDVDSVSDNDITSVSENDIEDSAAKRYALIKSAEEAFDHLLTEKDLMALLYHTDSYGARNSADKDSAVTATLEIGQTLYIKGIKITEDDVWYLVQFWLDGTEGMGYVQSYYLAYSDEDWIAWEEKYLRPILEGEDEEYGITAYGMTAYGMLPYAIDTSDINAFPGSYQAALRSLKSEHPNWTFVPMKTGLDFNTSVSKEMGAKSLIQKTTNNSSKGWVGNACPTESGWYYATQPAVAYHMDPRNFLTETSIFQFEQLTFNASYHTEEAVQTFLNGTFMKGKLADDSQGRTYAKAFYEIGKNRKLSPIHLASRVYQEQGQGTSGLISGTYPGYEGYYNFFNVGVNGASTAEKIVKGLTYAKEKGWNTRYKSLEGGAATIGNNYILKYQDTIYLEKFNVDKNSPYGVYEHQYMQNIQAPASESSSTRKMYENAGSLNSAFVFKIPVFDNMPEDQYYPTLRLSSTSITLDRSKAADCESGRQLKLYVDDVEVNPSEAVWKSSDISVVTVQDGLLKIAGGEKSGKAGEAVITATYQEIEVSCKVKVIISLQAITLDKAEIFLRRPDTVVQDTTGLSPAEIAENTDQAVLQVSFDPADTTADRKVTWTSKNAKIATVKADPTDDSKAVVSAVGAGKVEIVAKAAKAGGQTASCTVYVSAPICGITLTNRNAQATDPADRTTLLAGQSINLSAEYYPKDTTSDTSVVWSSSNPAVATVDNGRVTAVGSDPNKNMAVITAKVSGCESGYTAEHTVIVENCTVTFMKPGTNGMTVLGDPQRVLYGGTLSAETLREREQMLFAGGYDPAESIFIGWYTGENGTGRRFDETTAVYSKDIVLYPYYEEQGKGFYVLPIGDQTYTGSAIKPVVQVYDSVIYDNGERDLIELVLNKDYTVSYKNNKNVNQADKAAPTINVKGKGNYAGTQQVTFNIIPKALTDTDITADNITVAYSGKVIKSVPTVYRDGKKLTRNTDYTVTYPLTEAGAYKTAGTYPIVIQGKGGYSGTITIRQIITQDVLMSKVSIAKIPNQIYRNESVDTERGTGIEPELKVTYRNQPLVESVDGGLTGDYTVSYTNNTAIGTATATITAVEGSGYAGSKSINYKITGTSIAKAKVEGITNREYTGDEEDARQPYGAYTLTLNDQILTESTDNGLTGDYVTVYANTAKAGTASITFKGINEYTGQIRKSYKITAYNIGSDDGGQNPEITMKYYTQDEPYTQDKPERLKQIATLSEITAPYVKGGTKPTVLLYFKGNELTAGKDYTVKHSNNSAVTPIDSAERDEKKLPKITITGKGNFKGTISGTYTITDGRLNQNNGKITMTVKDMVYKGRKNTYKSTVTLKDCNGSKLAAGKDYDRNLIYTYAESVSWNDADGNKIVRGAGDPVGAEDIPAAGTMIRVTAKGMGAYAGETSDSEESPATISAIYRIVEADIAKAKVTAKAQVYRNGRAITLTPEDLKITVSGNPNELVYGVDYVIDEDTYTNHTNKGKATVIIRGIGNYGGEKKITYTIGSKTLVWWRNLFL
ncbi:MAG: Ig-like domain-containing protein [Lachnospiraceae bacterium]|nr:Ig-like domain-containing protein [Lachnospiraceae bacterium]